MTWPLTARSELFDQIGRAYTDGSAGGVVLTGAAGVGKTRLGEELLRAAASRPTAHAVGHPATQQIPLGALAHLLPPDLGRGMGGGEDDRPALFHRARTHLADRPDGQRLLLLVDDIDQLDATSLALLLPLTMERRIFLVATIRTGAILPSVVASLVKDGHLTVESVPVLTVDEVGTLLHRVLDGPVDTRAVARLAEVSGGNLQVLREIVHRSREQGTLVLSDGVWQLGDLPRSAGLDELIGAHLAELEGPELEALEALAVAGTLGLVDLDDLYGSEVVGSLDQQGLLRVSTDGRRTRVTVAHPIYGEILRQQMTIPRARQLQRALADRLEAHGVRRRDDVTQLALWRLEAGGTVDVEILLNAGRLAVLGREPDQARRFARAAGDGGRPDEAALIAVEAAVIDGDAAKIEEIVASVWGAPSLPQPTRSHLARRLANARFWQGDLEGALGALSDAEAQLDDPVSLMTVRAQRALLLANSGRPVEALSIIESVGPATDPRLIVDLAVARSIACLALGRFSEAIGAAREGSATQPMLPVWQRGRGQASHVLNEAHALSYSGHYSEARTLIEGAMTGARQSRARAAVVWFELVLGEIDRDSGRGRDAVRHFTSAADQAAVAGQDAALVWALVGIAQGHLLLGDGPAAAAALARADEHTSPLATSWATRERARAWLLACNGDLAGARDLIRVVAEAAREDHLWNFECGVVHDLVRFGDPESAVDRLGELEHLVEGPYIAALATHARAVVAGDPVLLAESVDRFAALPCLVLGAEAAMELAELHRRASAPRDAAAAVRRAMALLELSGGARTPALLRGDAVEPLSAREREVALLAAGGLPSREIAERLYLSKRTIDSHLSSAYRKLGVSGRSQLRAALDPAAGDGRPGAPQST
jgi:DNA-binding CsgD family transcriptional regulator